MAELVVCGLFLVVRKHVIGFRGFLKAVLRFLVARVLVGVVL